jgi:hypothetical protein
MNEGAAALFVFEALRYAHPARGVGTPGSPFISVIKEADKEVVNF